jgi:hypothetical protein
MKTATFQKSDGDKVVLVRKTAQQDAALLDRIVSEALSLLNGRKLTAAEAAAATLRDPRLAALAETYRVHSGKTLTEAALARLLAERLRTPGTPAPHVETVVEPPATISRAAENRICRSESSIAKTLGDLSELHKAAEKLAEEHGWKLLYSGYNAAADRVRAGAPLAVAVAEMKAAIRT